MKKTILVFGLFAGIGAAGQNKDLQDIQKLILDKQAKDKIQAEKLKVYSPQLWPGQNARNSTPYFLPNGDRIVYGTLDGMPIVQPDMRNFTVMPRVQPEYQLPHTMPNGSRYFTDLGVAGPNHIMDQLAPSPILDKLLKNSGK